MTAYTLSITVIRDGITGKLQAAMRSFSAVEIANRVGPAVADMTRRHLARNGRNKRGWPSTGFWEDASDNTFWHAAGDSVVIEVRKVGVRQRFKGGPIRPVEKRALAIPISPMSYGHPPSAFPGLFLLVTKKGAYLCLQGELSVSDKELQDRAVARRRKRKAKEAGRAFGNVWMRRAASLNFLYILSQGVDQRPAPEVLPTQEEYEARAKRAILN